MSVGKKINSISPRYCKYIPQNSQLEEGVLYISLEYKVAVHLCACGCKGKTVTPIGPSEWTLTDNNGDISLRPSIGNWSGENPYHAHYFITNSKIIWT